MRLKLATSPWWVQGAVYGVLFGAAMTVFSRIQTGAWVPAVVGGAGGGAFFGVFMGLTMSRINRRLLGGLIDLPPAEQRVVVRGSWRGPVPTDPRRRAEARALLERQRENLRRTRRWSLWVFGAAVVLDVFLAVTQSWWWLIGAALFLGFLVMTLITPSRLDKRLASFDRVAPR